MVSFSPVNALWEQSLDTGRWYWFPPFNAVVCSICSFGCNVVRKMRNRRLCGHRQVATLLTMGIILWGWRKWMKFLIKQANFKMAVSLEPFDRFWCFNFWEKALDVYFYSGMTAGPSDPYNRRITTAAASFGQHCLVAWCPSSRRLLVVF